MREEEYCLEILSVGHEPDVGVVTKGCSEALGVQVLRHCIARLPIPASHTSPPTFTIDLTVTTISLTITITYLTVTVIQLTVTIIHLIVIVMQLVSCLHCGQDASRQSAAWDGPVPKRLLPTHGATLGTMQIDEDDVDRLAV